MIKTENLCYSYIKGNKILDDISIEIPEGKIITIMGANGCGKSTLLNVLTKNLIPESGNVYLDGKNIKDMSLKEYARNVAIVHQKNTAPDDLTVERLVSYGRLPYSSIFSIRLSEENQKQVDRALELTELSDLRNREMGKLSGGQRQRAFIAMALAQNTKILFLDEPTTYLDVRYQVEVLRLIKELNEKHNITIIMVLHDISQAVYYSDMIIGLHKGKVIASGEPREVINSESIKKMYNVELPIVCDSENMYVLPV